MGSGGKVEIGGTMAVQGQIQGVDERLNSLANKKFGGVAQRLEQRLHKPRVAGSIPAAAI